MYKINYSGYFRFFLPLDVSTGNSHRRVAHGTLNPVDILLLLILVLVMVCLRMSSAKSLKIKTPRIKVYFYAVSVLYIIIA